MRKSLGLFALCLLGWMLLGGNVQQVVQAIVTTTCTNQFVRSLAATGAGTCASIAAGDFPALTGDVTTAGGSLATTLAAGSASNLNAGTLPAGRMPALTGDITTSAGAVATTIAANAVTNAKAAQMANSTVKCRTTAGTGNSEDCTAAQTAAIVGSVGGALKSKLLTITRDLTLASGSVAYTGVGFTPTSLVAIGNNGTGSITQYTVLNALADSSRSAAVEYLGGSVTNVTAAGTFLVLMDVTGSNNQAASITSYDADGFTLSWTKTASPTGTATIYVMCYR